jgi:hypothetical protein
MKKTSPYLVWAIIGVLVLSSFLPWMWQPAAGMTSGILDLAEWTTLHPSVYATSPKLLPSLLLRGSLMLLAVIGSIQATRTRSKTTIVLGLVLCFSLFAVLFPPLEFISDASDNLNYLQQFWLSVGCLVLPALVLVAQKELSKGILLGISILVSLGALVTCIAGLQKSLDLIERLGVAATHGVGGVLYVAGLAFLAALSISELVPLVRRG